MEAESRQANRPTSRAALALDDASGLSSSTRPITNGASSSALANSNGSLLEAAYASGSSSANGSHDSLVRTQKKRRSRLLDELVFASPGPAFQSTSTSVNGTPEAEESSADGDARARSRRSRPSHGSAKRTVSAAEAAGVAKSQASTAMSTSVAASPPKAEDEVSQPLFRNFSPSPIANGRDVPLPSRKGKERSVDVANQSNGHISPTSVGIPSKRIRRLSSKLRDEEEMSLVRRTIDAGEKKARISPSKSPHKSPKATAVRSNGVSLPPAADHTADNRIGALLSKKRSLVDRIYSDHDMLVREYFHLYKFVTLIGFEPEVAKQDHSDVFERFRMDYDLAAAVGASSSQRTTRHNISTRRGHLALPSVQSSPRIELPSKQKHESTKGRRVSQKYGFDEASGDAESSGQVSVRQQGDSLDSVVKHKSHKKRDLHASRRQSSDDSEQDDRVALGKRKKGSVSKVKTDLERDIIYYPREPIIVEQTDGIPRIRLLGPANLPRPPRHGSSFLRYLDSFQTTGEFTAGGTGELELIDSDELHRREERDASLYRKIDNYRSQGLLQSREEALKKSAQGRVREPARQTTPWDALLTQVTAKAARHRAEVRAKVALSKRLARHIQEYWDEKLGQGEKYRKAEERRIRQLAKWTVREVRKQWKLAVNVIRAQRQAREKAEKDRMGRQQLNSILEQSTQMLGRRQRALDELGVADSDAESDDDASSSGDDQSESEDASDGDSASSHASDEDDDSNDEDAASSSDDGSRADEDGTGQDESLHDSDAMANGFVAPSLAIDEEDSAMQESEPQTPLPYVNGHTLLDESEADSASSMSARRPQRSTRRLKPSLLKKAADERRSGHDIEDDDIDFEAGDDRRHNEDADLERQMWEDDEDSDSDDDGSLAADAEMPIEELMKKYGYANGNGVSGDANSTDDDDSDAASSAQDDDGDDDDDESASGTDQNDESNAVNTAEAETSDAESTVPGGSLAVSQRRSRSHTAASTPAAADRPAIKIKPPFLLRGNLRPYQQIGFEWLVNLYNHQSNGILADEMGLGKTIQTIALLGHLACDKGIWGPHLVVAPTSVMLNWEVEFKKFFPGFKVLSYYGSQRERKEKRKGWNTENSFNICITSYQLVLADQHILRRKPWHYLVLDEAHHIKNFRSQRWQTLLGFNSRRRLLLTGTPLQNNLMDLWSLMYFLMPNGVANAEGVVSSGFASMKEFQQWFSNPLDKAVESAGVHTVSEEMDNETRGMVSKLHTLLRPYLLRRLKAEVEREMPAKYEHVIKCRLSKRQQFLYNDFMSRAKTRESLASGNYLSIINCLMQLRKVCNHPDLFEERPILTSFAMEKSVVGVYEQREALVRRSLSARASIFDKVNLDVLNLQLNDREREHLTPIRTRSLQRLDASSQLPHVNEPMTPAPTIDTWSIDGYQQSFLQLQEHERRMHWNHAGYINKLRCHAEAPYAFDLQTRATLRLAVDHDRLLPYSIVQDDKRSFHSRSDNVHRAVLSFDDRRALVQPFVDRFAFVPPRAVALDMPKWALPELTYDSAPPEILESSFDTLHAPAVKLQIAFPDQSLLQYDCGKLQALATLMERCKAGGHRILIFTQMTKVLDILEKWLNYNGFNYLRLDGQTKIEDRQALTEKFNRDERIRAFILSTRSGGLGINLTGADTVLFWDLDWNFQIEAQCMDRAHRIGQTRDVHIYRFVSEHTIEENMLKKSQEKRLLDAMVIQDGNFTTEGLSKMSWIESMFDEGGRTIAGVRVGGGADADERGAQVTSTQDSRITELPANDRNIEQAMDAAEDEEDAQAAKTARAELNVIDDDFGDEGVDTASGAAEESVAPMPVDEGNSHLSRANSGPDAEADEADDADDEGGTIDDYMLRRVDEDWDYFATI